MKEKLVSHTIDLDNPPPLTEAQKEEIARLVALRDEDIDLSEMPEAEFKNPMRLRDFLHRPRKRSTTVRLDADVLFWLKSKGRGYQTRLNAILREAMKKDVA
jgi:uncharacterized protein (DUF4415 family)